MAFSYHQLGTDEQKLIDIIALRANAQRVEIRKRYKTMYGKDLMNDLKSELSGNLEDSLLALLEPSSLYDAKCLRRAMRVSTHKIACIYRVDK
jgi:annexin A7/11